MDSPLILKSKQFALDIIKVCNSVKREKKESTKLKYLNSSFCPPIKEHTLGVPQ